MKIFGLIKKYFAEIIYIFLASLLLWNIILTARISAVSKKAEQNKYVYVFDMDKLVANYPAIVEVKRNYDEQILKLTKEVEDAQRKIKNIKDAKVKEDFVSTYFNALVLKRDNLVSSYNNALQTISAKINEKLIEIAKQKNVPAIYNSKSLSVSTPYVVDVTGDVLATLK